MSAPVREAFLILAPVRVAFLTLTPVTAFFLICFVPTLLAGNYDSRIACAAQRDEQRDARHDHRR